jgi:hypothetical protein
MIENLRSRLQETINNCCFGKTCIEFPISFTLREQLFCNISVEFLWLPTIGSPERALRL